MGLFKIFEHVIFDPRYTQMDDDLLNFNYSLQPKNQIQFENKIKQFLRNISLNTSRIVEVEKYSDRYSFGVSRQDILKTITPEILSNELQKYLGMHFSIDRAMTLEDMDFDEENIAGSNDENSDENTLGGGDDYENNYFEDDDFVEENNNEEVF